MNIRMNPTTWLPVNTHQTPGAAKPRGTAARYAPGIKIPQRMTASTIMGGFMAEAPSKAPAMRRRPASKKRPAARIRMQSAPTAVASPPMPKNRTTASAQRRRNRRDRQRGDAHRPQSHPHAPARPAGAARAEVLAHQGARPQPQDEARHPTHDGNPRSDSPGREVERPEGGEQPHEREVGRPFEEILKGGRPGEPRDPAEVRRPGEKIGRPEPQARAAGTQKMDDDQNPHDPPHPVSEKGARDSERGNGPRPEDEDRHGGERHRRRPAHPREGHPRIARPPQDMLQREESFDKKIGDESRPEICRPEARDLGVRREERHDAGREPVAEERDGEDIEKGEREGLGRHEGSPLGIARPDPLGNERLARNAYPEADRPKGGDGHKSERHGGDVPGPQPPQPVDLGDPVGDPGKLLEQSGNGDPGRPPADGAFRIVEVEASPRRGAHAVSTFGPGWLRKNLNFRNQTKRAREPITLYPGTDHKMLNAPRPRGKAAR